MAPVAYSEAFLAWVNRWDIGPGMNDRWRGRGDQSPGYIPPKNYTGYDGMVGPGWIPILDILAESLIALGWDRSVSQIKEKFGTLRFYANNTTEQMDYLIHDAELASAETCEFCGKTGRLRRGGWIKTLCDKCHEERHGV